MKNTYLDSVLCIIPPRKHFKNFWFGPSPRLSSNRSIGTGRETAENRHKLTREKPVRADRSEKFSVSLRDTGGLGRPFSTHHCYESVSSTEWLICSISVTALVVPPTVRLPYWASTLILHRSIPLLGLVAMHPCELLPNVMTITNIQQKKYKTN